MQNIKELYNQVSDKFIKFEVKIDEIQTTVSGLVKQLEEAEKNYDIDTMGEITTKLEAYKKVYDRIRMDLAAHKEKINKRDALYNEINNSFNEDIAIEKKNGEIQVALKDLDAARKQVDELQTFLLTRELEKKAEYQEQLNRFNRYLAEPKNVSSLGYTWGYIQL